MANKKGAVRLIHKLRKTHSESDNLGHISNNKILQRKSRDMKEKSPTNMKTLLDRWIPAVGDSDQQLREMITFTVLCMNMLFCFISVLFIELFLPYFIDKEMFYARWVIYPCALLYLIAAYCLFVLKHHGTARLLIVANIFFSCLLGIMLTGGYASSPVTSLIVLPSLFSFVLMGVRAGVICSVISTAILIPASLMEIYGIYTPMQLIPNQRVWQSLGLFVPLVAMAMMVFSMIFYEVLAGHLRKALQEDRNRLHWDATHDALTGLPNRPEFYNRLELAIRNAQREVRSTAGKPHTLALVFFDLDGFKPINDKHGHHAGDIVLQSVSQRLASIVRGVDTVARLGGDEFAIILQGVSVEQETLDGIMKKILRAVAEPVDIDGKQVAVSASLGVAFYQENCNSSDLCKQADAAMYEAKRSKNTWKIYSATN